MRRMINSQITESDAFLELSLGAQALYFHILQNADDEGFLNNAKSRAKQIGANEEDLNQLLQTRFLLQINKVVVVKHWLIHNTLRKDRIKPTIYQEERGQLIVKDNGSYTEIERTADNSRTIDNQMSTKCQPIDNQMTTNCQPNADKCPPNIREDNIREYKIKENKIKENNINIFIPPTKEELEEYMESQSLMIDADAFINYYSSVGWKIGTKPMVNWKAAAKSKKWSQPKPKKTKSDPREVEKLLKKLRED